MREDGRKEDKQDWRVRRSEDERLIGLEDWKFRIKIKELKGEGSKQIEVWDKSKIGHPRGIGFAFHKAGRRTQTEKR